MLPVVVFMPNDLPLSPDVQVTNKCVKKKAKNVYFKRTWMELQKTFLSCITFKQLRKKIEEEESKLPPLPPLFGDYSVAHDEVDTQSRGYIPVDTPRKFRSNDYIPVTVETDGNCFFRSLRSLSVRRRTISFGTEVQNSYRLCKEHR